MKVRDVMTRDPVTVTPGTTIREAAALLRERHIGGLPVVEGGRVEGMITESDIMSLLKTKGPSDDLWLPAPLEILEVPVREYINWTRTKEALSDIGNRPVQEVMTSPAITVEEDVEIEDAASLMLDEGIARLPVVRGGKLVGIVAREDIVRGVASGSGDSA
ncbi:MAG: CBS domain-containing protein [Methanomicrobiales archaeon]|jgi:CBS domain-containing protein|nr:CBS domain-containing protein [Methanomicrobiales archaeon]